MQCTLREQREETNLGTISSKEELFKLGPASVKEGREALQIQGKVNGIIEKLGV